MKFEILDTEPCLTLNAIRVRVKYYDSAETISSFILYPHEDLIEKAKENYGTEMNDRRVRAALAKKINAYRGKVFEFTD